MSIVSISYIIFKTNQILNLKVTLFTNKLQYIYFFGSSIQISTILQSNKKNIIDKYIKNLIVSRNYKQTFYLSDSYGS